MADVTKKKILEIDTSRSQNNVKTLKQQLKELKEQLSQLDKGTEEYNRVAKQLADTNQKQIEINEAMKYSNKDLGATLGNLTRVSAGVMGAINGVNAAMQLMGIEGEDAEKAMKNIQLTMAIIQGMSAVDTAVKSITGLSNAFTKLGQAKVFVAGNTATSVAAEMAETGAMGSNTLATIENNKEAVKYTKQQYDNASATDASTLAIATETKVLEGHKVELQRHASAMHTAEGQLKRIELAYQQGIITEQQYLEMKQRANTAIEYSIKKIEEETAAINANTISKETNSGANLTGTKTTNNLADATDKAGKAAKTSSLAFIGWAAAIVGAVIVISKLIKKAGIAKHELKGLNAELAKMDIAANHSAAETIGKFEILRQKFVDAKESGEKMTKWVKDHTKELNELNIQNTTLNNLENIFINSTDQYIAALSKRWVAENKMKVMQEEYIENLKKQQTYTKLIEKYNINWNNPNNIPNLSDKYTLTIDGQEVTKTLEEWKDASFDAWMANRRILEDFSDVASEMTEAENELRKFGTTFTTVTNTTTRTLKEIIGDVKSLYKETLAQITTFTNTKGMFNGVYDELDKLRGKIYELVAGSLGTKVGDKFTSEFVEAIGNGFKGIDKYNITIDNIFDANAVRELGNELANEMTLLSKYVSGELKVTEDVVKKQREKVKSLKEEVTTVNEITNAVLAYAKAVDEQNKKTKEIEKWNREFEQTKRLYHELRDDTRTNNPFKDINQNILKATYSLQNLKDELSDLDAEETRLNALGIDNKEIKDRLEEIAKRRREIALEQFKLENELEEANYNKRLLDIEKLMEAEEKATEKRNWLNEDYELDWGNNGDTYNTELQLLNVQKQMFENQKKAIADYYSELMEGLEKTSEEYMLYEKERDAAILELDRQLAENRVAIEQETSRRRLKITQTYINAYQSLTGEIQNLLNAEMSNYDENSQQYKNMRYANGVIDTLSGTLSAFMSGIESGIPAPGNLALATVMSAITFAAGLAQLKAIKNETLTNSTNTNIPNFGTYDTLSYQQNSEILSSIQDQRIFVLENDITSTQRRVRVVENSTAF